MSCSRPRGLGERPLTVDPQDPGAQLARDLLKVLRLHVGRKRGNTLSSIPRITVPARAGEAGQSTARTAARPTATPSTTRKARRRRFTTVTHRRRGAGAQP